MADEAKAAIAELKGDLKTSTSEWNIVFGHHPIYTKGASHGALGAKLGMACRLRSCIVRVEV